MTFVVPERERWALPPLLRERAAELGARPFLSFGVDDATATYAEIDERTDRLAAGLAALGVRRGEGVLLMLGNRLEFVLSWFALSKLGAPHVPVNVDYRGEFLEHLANTAQARVMVLEDRFLETVAASLPRLPQLRTLIVVGAAPPALPGVDVRAFADVPLDAEPPAEEIGPGRRRLDHVHVRHDRALQGSAHAAREPPPALRAQRRAARDGARLGLRERAAAVPHQRPDDRLRGAHQRRARPARGALLGVALARADPGERHDAHVDARRDARVRARAAAIRGRP